MSFKNLLLSVNSNLVYSVNKNQYQKTFICLRPWNTKCQHGHTHQLLPCGSYFQVTQHIMSLETKSQAELHKKNRIINLWHKSKVRNCYFVIFKASNHQKTFGIWRSTVSFFFFFGIFIPGTELNFNLQHDIHVT